MLFHRGERRIPYRDLLSANPRHLDRNTLIGYAEQLHLKIPQFEACVDSQNYNAKIQTDVKDAGAVGIRGTPGFVVGVTTDNGFEGTRIVGAKPYAVFEKIINKALASGGKSRSNSGQ